MLFCGLGNAAASDGGGRPRKSGTSFDGLRGSVVPTAVAVAAREPKRTPVPAAEGRKAVAFVMPDSNVERATRRSRRPEIYFTGFAALHRHASRPPPAPQDACIRPPGPTGSPLRPSGGRPAPAPPTGSGRRAGRVPVGACGGRAQVSRVGGSRAGAGVRWGPLLTRLAAAGRPPVPVLAVCPLKWPLSHQRTCWFAIWEAIEHKSPYKVWLIRPLKYDLARGELDPLSSTVYRRRQSERREAICTSKST